MKCHDSMTEYDPLMRQESADSQQGLFPDGQFVIDTEGAYATCSMFVYGCASHTIVRSYDSRYITV